jgi:type II secretory pathway predicted ATPase ExeA
VAGFNFGFFGLEDAPFSVSPDPIYFYLSSLHRGILQKIQYVVRRRQGLGLVYGDVGVGKTSMAQILYNRLSETNKVYYIPSPLYSSPFHMAKDISDEFGLGPKISLNAQLKLIREHLIKLYEEGISPVLLLDEAQQLRGQQFEVLRQFSNFELPDTKLLQIILMGQSELRGKLRLKRALTSRIAITATLESFTFNDMTEMISFRLQRAGGNPEILAEGAYEKVFQLSKGNPREAIHTLGLALEIAFHNKEKVITSEIVQFAYSEAHV